MLKTDPRFANIWRHYRPLWSMSIAARYLEDADGKRFQDHLPPADVKAIALDHHLRQIERSAMKFLSKLARTRLSQNDHESHR